MKLQVISQPSNIQVIHSFLLLISLFVCGCSNSGSGPKYYESTLGKVEMPCPTQTNQTLVINAFGVGGSSIDEWVNGYLVDRYNLQMPSIYSPTHFL